MKELVWDAGVGVGMQEWVWRGRNQSGKAGIGVRVLESVWGCQNSDAGIGEGTQELVWRCGNGFGDAGIESVGGCRN